MALWRKLFSGIHLPGTNIDMDLDTAAKQVGISKKTLDDYLIQIRFFLIFSRILIVSIRVGKRFGFNFEIHHEEKAGVLRKFNRRWLDAEEEEKK